MIRVAHVITGLEPGGAEHVLLRLLRSTDRRRVAPAVISLQADGSLAHEIESLDIPVTELGLEGVAGIPRVLMRLRHLLAGSDVVQTWMYHADVLGGLAAHRAGIPVAWGLRQTDVSPDTTSWRTRTIVRLGARLSRRIPQVIVACGDAVAQVHGDLGYDPARMRVIPNGFTVQTPALEQRAARQQLGLPPDGALITRVGRWHPHKDIPTMLSAFETIAGRRGDVRLALCGPGLAAATPELMSLLDDMAVGADRVHLLGTIPDVSTVWAASDVACSSSLAEGFPNVVGEAMAAAVPVVATDVGDTRALVGDCGVVVPPRSAGALAEGLDAVLSMSDGERVQLGARAQARIRERFSLEAMAEQFQRLHAELAAAVRAQSTQRL